MLRTFHSSPWLWVMWAALLAAYLITPASSSSIAFWSLAVAAVAATVAQMIYDYKKADWEQETIDAIDQRLSALGATVDLTEDDDALSLLDVQGWEDVFLALERMPSGQRSVRQAILETHPQVLK